MRNKLLTLVVVRDETRVLLGMKKRGFGAGKWNGFGGKVDVGESIVQAAHRELEEECKITCDRLDEVGLLEFEFIGVEQNLQVHVFTSKQYQGTPTETEEMRPHWFPIDQIPFDKMWADDRHWLPRLLKGEKFNGFFRFRDQTLLDFTLDSVEKLNYSDYIRTEIPT